MSRLAGVTLDKNKKGEIKKITLNLKRIDKDLEEAVDDLIDHLIVEQRKNEPTIPMEKVIRKLNRKHGISRKAR